AAAGETAVRLHLVAVWREAGVFTEAERAALELAEQGTRVADAGEGVSDEVWTRAAVHYDQEQLTALVFLVAFMNTANRLNIIARQPAGDYAVAQAHRPGRCAARPAGTANDRRNVPGPAHAAPVAHLEEDEA